MWGSSWEWRLLGLFGEFSGYELLLVVYSFRSWLLGTHMIIEKAKCSQFQWLLSHWIAVLSYEFLLAIWDSICLQVPRTLAFCFIFLPPALTLVLWSSVASEVFFLTLFIFWIFLRAYIMSPSFVVFLGFNFTLFYLVHVGLWKSWKPCHSCHHLSRMRPSVPMFNKKKKKTHTHKQAEIVS